MAKFIVGKTPVSWRKVNFLILYYIRYAENTFVDRLVKLTNTPWGLSKRMLNRKITGDQDTKKNKVDGTANLITNASRRSRVVKKPTSRNKKEETPSFSKRRFSKNKDLRGKRIRRDLKTEKEENKNVEEEDQNVEEEDQNVEENDNDVEEEQFGKK